MASSHNLLVNKPLPGSTVHVLYAAARIDTDTTTKEMMEIGFAIFAEWGMAFAYSKRVWESILQKQLSEWTGL
jgi:hypothetical protein